MVEFEVKIPFYFGHRELSDKLDLSVERIAVSGHVGEYYLGYNGSIRLFLKRTGESIERIITIIDRLSGSRTYLQERCGACSYSIPLSILSYQGMNYVAYAYLEDLSPLRMSLKNSSQKMRIELLTGLSFILRELQRNNIAHMDLKPANVFMIKSGSGYTAYLSDIDEARVFDNDGNIMKSDIIANEYRLTCSDRDELEKTGEITTDKLSKIDLWRYTFFVAALSYKDFFVKALTLPYGPWSFIVRKKNLVVRLIERIRESGAKGGRMPEKEFFDEYLKDLIKEMGLRKAYIPEAQKFFEIYHHRNNLLRLGRSLFTSLVYGYFDHTKRIYTGKVLHAIRERFYHR